jgi:hypothetical protein
MAVAPANWYADPAGDPNWRYWDGAGWTEHVSPYAMPAQEPTPAPAPEPPVPTTPASLSPSALVYFFADRVVAHGGIGIYGVGVPCRPGKVKVKTKALAGLQLAMALWDLRERRLIGLELVETQSRKGAPETRLAATVIGHVESGTLEGWLLERLRLEPSVRMAFRIETWRGGQTIIDGCREEAIALGYLGRGTYWRDHWEGDCAKISTLEPSFDEAWARWERFGQVEAQLAARLVADCLYGLPYKGGV